MSSEDQLRNYLHFLGLKAEQVEYATNIAYDRLAFNLKVEKENSEKWHYHPEEVLNRKWSEIIKQDD